MEFWWVNHKQTARAERDGNYIWAPKRNAAGRESWSYNYLPKTRVGDVVFSYAQMSIGAVGVVVDPCIEFPRPFEFGKAGEAWNALGWRVGVQWQRLPAPVFPKLHLADIVPLLKEKYSPIQSNGNGNMSCYLTHIEEELGWKILELADETAATLERTAAITEAAAEKEETIIQSDETISATEKDQIIKARKGQGKFRKNVEGIERSCRLTGVTDKQFLIASHIKPWQASTNAERLDGNNGFLLSPHVDKLFDRGWISFSKEGQILLANKKVEIILRAWRIDQGSSVGRFNDRQQIYLDYHRSNIFKRT